MNILRKILGHFSEREPRIEINRLHDVLLHLVGKNQPYPLYNLSSSGLAFLLERHADPEEYPVDKTVNARLELAGQKGATLHLNLRFAHSTPTVVGCEIMNTQEEMRHIIYDYFEYEVLAHTLRYFPPKDLKKEVDGEPHWFTGDNNCSLFLVAKNNHVVRFFLSYFGNVVEMNANHRISWGLVYDGSDMDQGFYYPHDEQVLVRNFSEQSKDIAGPIVRFVSGLPQLHPTLKKEICDKIQLVLS